MKCGGRDTRNKRDRQRYAIIKEIMESTEKQKERKVRGETSEGRKY